MALRLPPIDLAEMEREQYRLRDGDFIWACSPLGYKTLYRICKIQRRAFTTGVRFIGQAKVWIVVDHKGIKVSRIIVSDLMATAPFSDWMAAVSTWNVVDTWEWLVE